MARILYFDCFNGASGDMVLGALLDAGLPLDDLRRALGSLAVDASVSTHARASSRRVGNKIHRRKSKAQPRRTSTAHAHEHSHTHTHGSTAVAHHAHRSLAEINRVIERSALSPAAQSRAKELFNRLGEAEAAIHQIPLEKIHLHEVGEIDSIIDIVGAVFALEWFDADQIISSPLNVGGGMVQSAHGNFPVPAPATVKLLGRSACVFLRHPERARDANRRACW